MIAYGEALLEADTERVGAVDALGLDETLFNRIGEWRTQQWCTSIVDVGGPGRPAKLIDIVEGRSATKTLEWLGDQPEAWKQAIRWGVLDMSGPYRKVFNDGLGHVRQVADPFHLTKLANDKLDECRRRVQNETLGHRGRKDDPLYRGTAAAHQGPRTPRRTRRDQAPRAARSRRPPRRGSHGMAQTGDREEHL